MQLKDKSALVTGAARGIGLGIAHCLMQEGARVAIVDLDAEEAQAAARNLGNGTLGLAADASSEAEMTAAARQAAAQLGGLDIFVNNAGGARPDRPEGREGAGNPFTRITERGWDEQVQTNLRTTFAGCKAAIPALLQRGGGAIVNIASIAGQVAVSRRFAYGTTKGAVISMTQSTAMDYVDQGIRCNCICPGTVETPFVEAYLQKYHAGEVEETRKLLHARQPLGRMGRPNEIAPLALYLASDEAAYVTGAQMVIDGGLTAR